MILHDIYSIHCYQYTIVSSSVVLLKVLLVPLDAPVSPGLLTIPLFLVDIYFLQMVVLLKQKANNAANYWLSQRKLLLLLSIIVSQCNGAFLFAKIIQSKSHGTINIQHAKNGQFHLLQSAPDDNLDLNLDDVTPPSINFRKESILFGDNPATKRNNFFLDVWQDCQSTLPTLLTGGSDTNNNSNNNNVDPAARLYNMIFVRGPTVIVGLFYVKNTVTGHPLIVDIGHGPFEVSPLIVAGVLYMILRIP
jgi:hypothetical protein